MPSHLHPCWDQLWLFVLLDLLLNYPSIILVLQNPPLTCTSSTPQAVASLSQPLSSHLFWARDPAPAPRQPSLHCDTSFPSDACRPPANRDWWGGTDRCETWPSSGAHRTRPRSLTSLLRCRFPQQTGSRRERGMQELKDREIRLLLSWAPQPNEVSWIEENTSQYQRRGSFYFSN